MTGKIDRRTLIVGSALVLFPTEAVGQEEATPASAETVDWDSLRRPLNVPTLDEGALCPRSEGKRFTPQLGWGLGDGAVHPVFPGPDGVFNYGIGGGREDAGWYYYKVLWAATADYPGPILVRGHQLDGPHEVRFDEGADPPAELRLGTDDGGLIVGAPGMRNWPGHTRVRAPGCYAYQVDGLDSSEVIVFQAVAETPGELTPVPVSVDGKYPLPRNLFVVTGVRTGPDAVRLALLGAEQLLLRLDVGPTQGAPLALSGRDLETAAGVVHWVADGEDGWPAVAAWDDGRRRYRLEVLDVDPDARSDAWSEGNLAMLVQAFAAAPAPAR
jgi:hypothetical protein